MDTDINYIIQESIKGDKIFQEILLTKLRPLIYKNIYKYYSIDDNIIEDLVQEGYIVILQSLKSFDKKRNAHFLRYIKIELEFYYKNYYRDTKHQRETISLDQKLEDDNNTVLEDVKSENEISIIDKITKEEKTKKILDNIKKLSAKEQQIINLYYNDELTMEEISKLLNIAYRTAIGRKYTAIKKLKKLMDDVNAGGENDG